MIKNIFYALILFNITTLTYANNGINNTLNSFHHAASQANVTQYFDLLTDDAVFLGTDATERWTKKEFKHYVEPMFKKGHGWTYKTKTRHITLSEDKKSAFFDELLENKNYGLCRGSGLLYKTKKGWKIAQYNLSVPLPNEITKEIIKRIEHHQKSQVDLTRAKVNKHGN